MITARPAAWDWVRWFQAATARLRGISTLLIVVVGLAIPAQVDANNWQGAPARQVVVFGVVATPGSTTMDSKIAPVVQAQLRRLLPNHGFQVIKIQSDRVTVNKSVQCVLVNGFVATAHLTNLLDPNGKVQMRFELSHHEVSQFQTIVATPPDQFNFFDKAMPDGTRLLVGVGAR